MGEKREEKPAKILIVDDLEINVSILENIIRSGGYEPICALSVQEALELMKENMPQLVLSDYYMPDMNGMEFCRLLKKNPKTRDIPFLLITVADSSEDKRQAFEAGAVDYIPKPFEPIEVIIRVKNQLNSYYAKQKIEEYNRMMHRVVREQKHTVEQERKNLLEALIRVMERRGEKTAEHLERIAYNSRILARSLQLSVEYEQQINDEYVDEIYTAAKLCDIGFLTEDGKAGPEGGLCHPKDREGLQRHITEGAGLLKEIGALGTRSRALELACDIAAYHHAHWDGSGVPAGAADTEIPLAARIVSLALGFERAVLEQEDCPEPVKEACRQIGSGSGSLYEPYLTEVFFKIVRQLKLPR